MAFPSSSSGRQAGARQRWTMGTSGTTHRGPASRMVVPRHGRRDQQGHSAPDHSQNREGPPRRRTETRRTDQALDAFFISSPAKAA